MSALVWLVLLVDVVGPLATWASVYIAMTQNIFELRSMLRVLKLWRWLSWISAMLLWIAAFAPLKVPWPYGTMVLTFSIGLAIPENWLKKRVGRSESTAGRSTF